MSPVTKADSASLWRSMRVVAWSFVGIRRGSASQQDMARVKPLHVIAVGIAGAALFVVSLVILVNWVVAK
jgi:Protein of unknown function (DUF2970)